jgi:hypothetical protein
MSGSAGSVLEVAGAVVDVVVAVVGGTVVVVSEPLPVHAATTSATPMRVVRARARASKLGCLNMTKRVANSGGR